MNSPAAVGSEPPFTLANTHSWVDQGNGGGYRISVALPSGPAPVGGFPVLYLLDAGATFATVVETHRRLARRPDATGVVPACIVGIGHDSGSLYDAELRQKDFLAAGGAEPFLRYLTEVLQPRIERELAVNPARRILLGHSLAGLFTLWTLVTQPQSFSAYVSLSPSLWSDPGLLGRVGSLVGRQPRVFIGVGGWEEALPPWMRQQAGSEEIAARRLQRRMASNAEEFAQTLKSLDRGPETRFQLFADEDHASVFAIGISRAMRFVLSPG